MINIPKDKCCGCQACLNICSKNAIAMIEDGCGFLYPSVNDNCVKCGLCLKVCPELNDNEFKKPLHVYALVSKEKTILGSSASGGFATVLAGYIISQDGVVYGCSEKNFESISHIRIESEQDLYKLQNSKYVHSDIGFIYRQAKQDLEKGKKVLFTGTPCQISGLKKFLMKPYMNLLTMDLVCHGVPSMKMLKQQISSYKELKDISTKDIYVLFRWKEPIRIGCSPSIRFGLRTVVRSGRNFKIIRSEDDLMNAYMRCFQTGISLRESCLQCQYAQNGRVSDITVGDFWGLGAEVPSEINANNGASLVLINTSKGFSIFTIIENFFLKQERTLEEAEVKNRCLRQPFPRLEKRDLFLKICAKKGLIAAAKATDKAYYSATNPLYNLIRKNKYLYKVLSISRKIIHSIKK